MSAVSFHTRAMKANLLGATAVLIGAFALSACAERVIPPSAPATTPPPRAEPRPVPTATAWADLPATPGDWRWSMQGGESVARFAGNRLVMRCEPGIHAIHIERSEPGGSPVAATPLIIRTQTMTRSLSAVPQAGVLVATLGARDPLLDAMAFSRGRFAVEASGLPQLRVPSWTEVSRVIEDCR